MSPVADYEVFEYTQSDEPTLSLDQAAAKAASLRRTYPANAYRVVPVDSELSGFRVIKVPVTQVYGEMWSRLYKQFARYMFAPRVAR